MRLLLAVVPTPEVTGAAGVTAEQVGTWIGRHLLGPGLLVVAAVIIIGLGLRGIGGPGMRTVSRVGGQPAVVLLGVIGLVTFLRVVPPPGGPLQAPFGGGAGPSRPATQAPPSRAARSDIPAGYLAHYQAAAKTCPALSWQLLAAIGKIESDHGRANAPGVHAGVNRAGCCAGPMQFNLTDGPPSTWQQWRRPGDNVYDPADAIPAAARKLCGEGLRERGGGPDPCPSVVGPAALHRALKRYNNACWYVRQVAGQAGRYGGSV
jgi:hypothetical protein